MKLTVLLGALIALPALGTDFFVPALPALAESYAVDAGAAHLTITAYFGGIAAGQLLWGPLSDRYGRKPVLLVGLATMLVSSLGALAAESIASLSAARLAQGLGMSSGAVMGRSVARDLYAHDEAARMLSAMMVVFSVVPITAPLAGALLAGALGWQAIFAGMAAIAAGLLAWVAFGLAESAPAERRSAHPLAILRTFAHVLREPRFVAPFLLVLCCHVGILAWVSNSALTLIRGMGISPFAYGLMFGFVATGQIAGAAAGTRLIVRLGTAGVLRLGAGLLLAAGGSAAALAWTGLAHWAAVVAPFALFLFGAALVIPTATAAALTPFPSAAGSASSLMGAIGFSVGALVSTLLGSVFDGSARPMATFAGIAGVAAVAIQLKLFHGKA
ncbi:MAG TPA: multidrug effflux MFS transporter [Burkholderiales bacterium]|nr:multidrug effflux MFS transporter [Burkholderiales bacterium]